MKRTPGPRHSRDNLSTLFCRTSWHLKGRAFQVYEVARALSRKSGVCFVQAETLAEFFKCDDSTIYRALKELRGLGFLKSLDGDKPPVGKSVRYQVVSHKDWAEAHPGQCLEKMVMPWTGQGEPFGRELYAISGGRVKFLPHQIATILRAALSEKEIANIFRKFVEQMDEEGCKTKYVPGRFIQALRMLGYLAAPVKLRGRAKTLYDGALQTRIPVKPHFQQIGIPA